MASVRGATVKRLTKICWVTRVVDEWRNVQREHFVNEDDCPLDQVELRKVDGVWRYVSADPEVHVDNAIFLGMVLCMLYRLSRRWGERVHAEHMSVWGGERAVEDEPEVQENRWREEMEREGVRINSLDRLDGFFHFYSRRERRYKRENNVWHIYMEMASVQLARWIISTHGEQWRTLASSLVSYALRSDASEGRVRVCINLMANAIGAEDFPGQALRNVNEDHEDHHDDDDDDDDGSQLIAQRVEALGM